MDYEQHSRAHLNHNFFPSNLYLRHGPNTDQTMLTQTQIKSTCLT